MHLPGKITYREIDEMIATVDKNEDWKISYSEFRVWNTVYKRLPRMWPSKHINFLIFR